MFCLFLRDLKQGDMFLKKKLFIPKIEIISNDSYPEPFI